MLRLLVISILLALPLGGCGLQRFQAEAEKKFGDQDFKTAIALIELHRVRFGEYPDALSELRFLGEWDKMALDSVSYERVGSRYRLALTQGWGAGQGEYPAEFWHGLGIERPAGETPGAEPSR
jgi:hypothetical protein